VSVEMVQKTATLGAKILLAVWAPTALAVRVDRPRDDAGHARDQDLETVFCRPLWIAASDLKRSRARLNFHSAPL
jgi:hypothetical protein